MEGKELDQQFGIQKYENHRRGEWRIYLIVRTQPIVTEKSNYIFILLSFCCKIPTFYCQFQLFPPSSHMFVPQSHSKVQAEPDLNFDFENFTRPTQLPKTTKTMSTRPTQLLKTTKTMTMTQAQEVAPSYQVHDIINRPHLWSSFTVLQVAPVAHKKLIA